MNWLEQKYTQLCSHRLERFKKVGKNWNFRCPFCLDSQKNKRKARGWILDKPTGAQFYCHNGCGGKSFKGFLHTLDVNLYYDFIRDTFADQPPTLNRKTDESVDRTIREIPDFSIKLKRVTQLPENHPVVNYVSNRLIPKNYWNKIFIAPHFKAWTNSLIKRFDDLSLDEPRLIFPLYDENNKFFGFQGRSFKPNDPTKYITILLDESKPKLFGLERLDKHKTNYIVEGPIDSLFVDNCLASCGGRLDTDVDLDTVIIYDNEPRSPDTIKKIEKAMNKGHPIVIWPESIVEKDINDMVKSGIDVMNLIKNNTYSGLEAELKFTEWKKC